MRCHLCRKNFSYNKHEYLKKLWPWEQSALLQTVIVFQIIFERSTELLSVLGLVGEGDFDKGIKIFVVGVSAVRSAV